MPFTLEELLPREQQLRSIQLHEPVTQVLDIMRQNRFDQLPVVANDGQTALGMAVTYDSILQAVRSFKTEIHNLTVKDVARVVTMHSKEADLLATLNLIQNEGFIIITNETKKLTGIVTTADTTVFFREYAEDLMLIEGIETQLKEGILNLYGSNNESLGEAIASVTDKSASLRKKLPVALKTYVEACGLAHPDEPNYTAIEKIEKILQLKSDAKNFEQLSFDEFIEVLLRHPQGPRLSSINKIEEIRFLLQQVRDSRNKLAHFRGDLTPSERSNIRFATEWLERNMPITSPGNPPISSINSAPEPDDDQPIGLYSKLAESLKKTDKSVSSFPTTFSGIESIIGKELPRSAYEYRHWWANDPTQPQAACWLNEGWRAMSVNIGQQQLSFVRTEQREKAYISFFAKVNTRLKKEAIFPLRNTSPQGASWHTLAFLELLKPNGIEINAAFTNRKELRVEMEIDCGVKDRNKQEFDRLLKSRAAIEEKIGEPLEWKRMNDRQACRISVYTNGQILLDSENNELVDWVSKRAVKFFEAFAPYFQKERNDSKVDPSSSRQEPLPRQ